MAIASKAPAGARGRVCRVGLRRRCREAAVALDGDVELIAQAGGGWSRGIRRTRGEEDLGVLLVQRDPRSLFERSSFEYQRPKGKNHCVMRKVVTAQRSALPNR